jgi:hypothetical protein
MEVANPPAYYDMVAISATNVLLLYLFALCTIFTYDSLVNASPVVVCFKGSSDSDRKMNFWKLFCGDNFTSLFNNHLPGNTKVRSITVPLTSCLTGFESAV